MGGYVANALAGAKTALENANKSSVGTKSGHSNFSQPQTHEYSHAPYSIANAARSAIKKVAAPVTGLAKEASDAGVGISERLATQHELNKQ